MAGKEAVLILLASCWEGQVLAGLFLPEDLAGIEPLLLTRHLSRKQFTLVRLKWSWPYLACLFVIHLIYWPGSWLAAVSLILLFAAAARMTLYQRRYLGGIKDSIWVFVVFALLRLLATLLFKI